MLLVRVLFLVFKQPLIYGLFVVSYIASLIGIFWLLYRDILYNTFMHSLYFCGLQSNGTFDATDE
jgi:hypothetical protein